MACQTSISHRARTRTMSTNEREDLLKAVAERKTVMDRLEVVKAELAEAEKGAGKVALRVEKSELQERRKGLNERIKQLRATAS